MEKYKFDYYLEFHKMRLSDANFAEKYDAHEFEIWYADFTEILNQKYGEPANEE